MAVSKHHGVKMTIIDNLSGEVLVTTVSPVIPGEGEGIEVDGEEFVVIDVLYRFSNKALKEVEVVVEST